MIHLLFFLAALLLLGAAAFVATRGRISEGGDLRREGPARIADTLKRRNRLWMLVVLALVVVVALVELFLAPLHDALIDLQYDLGGSDLGSFDAAMGGVSWLLYVSLLVGRARWNRRGYPRRAQRRHHRRPHWCLRRHIRASPSLTTMPLLFLLAGGGTGAKVAEALVHLCATGMGPEHVHVLFVDADTTNGNLQRARATA